MKPCSLAIRWLAKNASSDEVISISNLAHLVCDILASDSHLLDLGASRFLIKFQLLCAGLPQVPGSGPQRYLPLADAIS